MMNPIRTSFLALLVWACAVYAVNANPFDTYAKENNAKKESISVFSPKLNKFYRVTNGLEGEVAWEFGEPFSVSKPVRWGTWAHTEFSQSKWSRNRPGLGIARYKLVGGTDDGIEGWMTFEYGTSGKIEHMTWTLKDDADETYGAELGQAADITSTAVDFAAEANPIIAGVGLGPAAILKLGGPTVVEHFASHATCAAYRDVSQDFGWMAGVQNIPVLTIGGPLGLAIGVVAGQFARAASNEHHNGFYECLPDDLRAFVNSI